MKIGLVNEYCPPFAPGGAEWSMLALAQKLNEAHQVIIITPNYGAAAFEELAGVRIYRFSSRARFEPGQKTLRYRWLANPFFYRHSAREIERIARSEQLDILHSQNKYSLPGTWLAARRLAIPTIYTIRDTSMICQLGRCLIKYRPVHPQCGHWQHWWSDCRPAYIDFYLPGKQKSLRTQLSLTWLWLDTHLRRWFLRRVSGIVGVSDGILQVYKQAGLVTSQPNCAIYNIPPDQSSLTAEALTELRLQFGLTNEKVVFYAGRFSLGKGTPDLVAAADEVVKTVSNVLFLFAGQGNLILSGPHTRSLGPLSQAEVAQLYHLADVVVVPSRQPEPLTRVALEAMAAGRPLVGTQVGGTPELIKEGVNGFLVEPGQPAQLAQALIDLLVDDDLRAKMGQASRKRLQTHFAAVESQEKLLTFYRQAIERQAMVRQAMAR